MIDSSTFTKDMLSNPTKLSTAIIDAMEASDVGGGLSINDPNNGFVMQMLANNFIFSKFSEKIDYINSFYYSHRARTSDQLYVHLSEFDFVNLMASPATVPFVFAMSKDWIVTNAVRFDDNYNKIQIPATSFITMGGVIYSMYYPIDIFVNRNTGAVDAFYNTEITDRLNTLSSNMLLDVHEYTKDGLNWFQIQFNAFQFERVIKKYTVASEQGFSVRITHNDQFYAAKVFNLNGDGSWTELKYSLSQMNYDYRVPTALLTMFSESSEIKVEIPQIYFDNNQISQTIRIELYSTKGAVNYSLSATDVLGLKANFDTSSSVFAAPLAQMPTWRVMPTSTEVVGGSNARTYDEIRDDVVNQRLHDRVAITPPELVQAGLKAGFSLTRVIDDLTDRMYYASNVLVDSKNMVVPTFTGNILITDDSLQGDPSTIIHYTDGYNTILPTTTFKINNDSITCTPLSNGEVNILQALTKEQQVVELNKGNYIRQPFHVTLLTTAKSPVATTYNLMSPEMTSLVFLRENPHSAPQMSVLTCTVEHQNYGAGGYRVVITAERSSNITSVGIGNFNLLLTCKTKVGESVYLPATYLGTDNNQNDVWEVIFATDYHITVDNHITVVMRDSSHVLVAVEIPLNQQFIVLSSFITVWQPQISRDVILNDLLPQHYAGAYTVMSQQSMQISFGTNMSDQIYCGVDTTWGNDVYEVAEETIYLTTNVPIFQNNEIGVLETRKNPDTDAVEVLIIYDIGSTPAIDGDLVVTSTADVPTSVSPTQIPVSNVTGFLVGMNIRGLNIPVDSKITDITDLIVTIDQTTIATIPAGSEITVTNPKIVTRVTTTQTAPGVQLEVTDTSNLLVGQSVYAFGLPTNAKVASIDSATLFSLDIAPTAIVTEGVLLTFINNTAGGAIKTKAGDILVDPTGAPIIVKAASNQYSIPAILFDGRMFASDDPVDQLVIGTISQRLQVAANQISTIDSEFLSVSDVFYKPARTMGMATFGVGKNKTIRLSLSLSFIVTVYVDVATYNTETALSTMKSSIYSIINSEVQKPIISVSDVATVIKDQLGSSVSAVELAGINGDETLRLIALQDSSGTPGVEYTLVLQSDNVITREPNIQITFIPKPATL